MNETKAYGSRPPLRVVHYPAGDPYPHPADREDGFATIFGFMVLVVVGVFIATAIVWWRR